jgi:hypothetical protein
MLVTRADLGSSNDGHGADLLKLETCRVVMQAKVGRPVFLDDVHLFHALRLERYFQTVDTGVAFIRY